MNDKCYIITYQLPNNLASLTTAIKSYGTWAKITDNTWAVVTTKSSTEIRNYLNQFIQSGGSLFVIKSGVEAAWNNVACKSEWLKKYL